jgi:hypothetical protein
MLQVDPTYRLITYFWNKAHFSMKLDGSFQIAKFIPSGKIIFSLHRAALRVCLKEERPSPGGDRPGKIFFGSG